MEVKVPSFYKEFRCKCGNCRHTCCHGWKITLSYVEYCRLVGLDCSPELRRKLDTAFYLLDDRDESRYAAMNLNYFGDCPMLNEKGYCSIHSECGEEFLPLICRLYPRNIVYCAMEEGALSNSCEGVIDLLINRTEPFQISSMESPYSKDIPVSREDREIQRKTFEILCDRSLSLDQRFISLGVSLGFDFNESEIYDDKELFSELLYVIEKIEEHSPIFKEYSIFAKEDLQILHDSFDPSFIAQRYAEAKRTFVVHYPNHETILENVMTNHLFYQRFPYSDRGESIKDKYIELCGVFVILRFIVIAYTEHRSTKENLVDCISGVFRCFEHSSSSHIFPLYLHSLGEKSINHICDFVKKI